MGTDSPLPMSKPVTASPTSKPTAVNKTVSLATPSSSYSISRSPLPTVPSTTSSPAMVYQAPSQSSVHEKVFLTIPPTHYSDTSSLSLSPTSSPSARYLTTPVSE